MKDPSMMVRSSAEKAMRKLGGGIAAPEPLSLEDVAKTGTTATSAAPADSYRPPPHREAEVTPAETAPEATPQPDIYRPPATEEPAGAQWPPRPEEPTPGAPEAVEPYSLDVLQPPGEEPAAEALAPGEKAPVGEWQPQTETSFEEPPATLEEIAGEETVEPEEAVPPEEPTRPEAPWPETKAELQPSRTEQPATETGWEPSERLQEEGPPPGGEAEEGENGRRAEEVDPAVTLEELIRQSAPPEPKETVPETGVEVPEWVEPGTSEEPPQENIPGEGPWQEPPPNQE
jgi:hypothetical protein